MKKYALVEVTETNEIPFSSYLKVSKIGGMSEKELKELLAKTLHEDYFDDFTWEEEQDKDIKNDYRDKAKIVINTLKNIWKI